MDLVKKIKLLIWTLPVAALFVTMCETATVPQPQALDVDARADDTSKEPTDRPDEAFAPSIQNASDGLRYFSVRRTAAGYRYDRPATAVGLRSLLDDYQFPLLQRLSFLARSHCGLREAQYIGAAPGTSDDGVAVRIFWTCGDDCLIVVGETARRRDVGRSVEIPIAREVCVDTWAGRGIPLASAGGDP